MLNPHDMKTVVFLAQAVLRSSDNTVMLQRSHVNKQRLKAGLGNGVAAFSRRRTRWSSCTERSIIVAPALLQKNIAISIAWTVIRPGSVAVFLNAWYCRAA
jgi:hypothetical protein